MNLLKKLFSKKTEPQLPSSKNIYIEEKADSTGTESLISNDIGLIDVDECINVYESLKEKWEIDDNRTHTLYKYLYENNFSKFLIGAILDELGENDNNSEIEYRDEEYHKEFLETGVTQTEYYFVGSKIQSLSFLHKNILDFIANCQSLNLSTSHHSIGTGYVGATLKLTYDTKGLGQTCCISIIEDDKYFITNYMSQKSFDFCLNAY